MTQCINPEKSVWTADLVKRCKTLRADAVNLDLQRAWLFWHNFRPNISRPPFDFFSHLSDSWRAAERFPEDLRQIGDVERRCVFFNLLQASRDLLTPQVDQIFQGGLHLETPIEKERQSRIASNY